MPVNRSIFLLAAVFLSSCTIVQAESTTNATSGVVTNRLPFDVGSKQEFVTGLPPATRIYITNGTESYALLTPAGYRFDTSAQASIQLANEAYDCFMTFRIVEGELNNKEPLDSVSCRALLCSRYPDANILEESLAHAGGLSGPAFDFRWKDQGKTTRAGRVVFIRSRSDILEFTLICTPDKLQQVRYDFDSLLLSFRASKDGKLEIMPRSNLF